MITNAQDMLKALKRGTFRGVILYQGASAIDGAPIVAIANRITNASNNVKTGAMVQTFIIRADKSPLDALKDGSDKSVCGTCIHRPRLDELTGKIKRSCYVNVSKSVMSVFGAYERGRYARPNVDYDSAILPNLFAGLIFRIGAYGDGVAVPFQIWRACTLKTIAKNGYTHQWRDARFQAFKLLCMASADSVADLEQAHSMGWRTFRVRHASEAKQSSEAICPASKEAGYKTTCATCRACGGTSAKAKVSMVIMAHGPTASHFAV